jgi:hypothetical protein
VKVSGKAKKFSLLKNPPAAVKKIANKETFRSLSEREARSIQMEYQLITKDATLAEQRTPLYKTAQNLESILDEVVRDIAGHTSTFSRVPTQITGALGYEAPPVQFVRPPRPAARRLQPLPASQSRPMPRPRAQKRPAEQVAPPRTRVKRQDPGGSTPPNLEALAEAELMEDTPEDILQQMEGSGLRKKPKKRVKRRKSKQKTSKKAAKSPKKQSKRPKTALQKWNSRTKVTRRMRL